MMRLRHVLTLVLVLIARSDTAFTQAYHAYDMSAPPGFTNVVVTGLNNRNQVVGRMRPPIDVTGTSFIQGPTDAFVWDSARGIRLLHVGRDVFPRIDDAGVIYGLRSTNPPLSLDDLGSIRVFSWIDGVTRDLVTPPSRRPSDLFSVRRNAIVHMGHWALYAGALYDLRSTYVDDVIWDVNERGVIGGCVTERIVDRPDPLRWPYLRRLDGQLRRPWAEGCVTIVGPAGHFAGLGWPKNSRDHSWYYGTPDGGVTRLESSVPRRLIGINVKGDLLLDNPPMVRFEDGTSIDLEQAPTTDGRPVGGFVPVAINDQGNIAGHRVVHGIVRGVLLVPIPAPPSLTFGVSGGQVTLAWSASREALHYILEAGSVPGAANLYSGTVGTDVALTVAAPPGRYFVRVRGVGANGPGLPSNEVTIDVP